MEDVASIQLGELLVRGGMLPVEHLEEVYNLAVRMRLPIGRVLAMQGHVSEDKLAAAIEIQARIRDRLMTPEQGIQILGMMSREGFSLDMALGRSGTHQQPTVKMPVPSNRLGELLKAAGIISYKHLEDGLRKSMETGLPLGRVLVSLGVMTQSTLISALAAQRLVRDGKLERNKAIYALKAAHLRSAPIEETLREQNINPQALAAPFGLGELLLMGGVITDTQLTTAKEIELVETRPLEQVLLDCGFIIEPTYNAAMQLLQMISQGVLFEDQAAEILGKIKNASSKEELSEILTSLDQPMESDLEGEGVDVTLILKKSGFISEKEIQIATSLALANRMPLVKTLFDAGLIDHKILSLATQCKALVDSRFIVIEQAVIAIVYALDNNFSLDKTLEDFGWSAPKLE